MRSRPTGAPPTLNPDSTPAQLGLGNTLKTVGRQAEAIEAYRRATVLRPAASEAWWSLSNLKTFRFEDAEIAEMERQLARDDLGEEQRVQFSFALAKAREDRGEYARAFELYAAGNRARRALEHYDPVQTEVINDRIRAVFDAEFLARHAGVGRSGPGADLRRRAAALGLDADRADPRRATRQVDATHELPEVGRLIQQIGRDRDGPRRLSRGRPRLTTRRLGRARALLSRGHAQVPAAARRASSTRCRTTSPNIGLLALALPNARIVNARRHPLDTCLSCYRQLFARGQPFTYDLTELGEYYLEYEKMMAHWHAVLPGRVLDVQYEDMVADLEGQSRRLLRILRPALGRRLPALLGNRARDPHGELRAGAPAHL